MVGPCFVEDQMSGLQYIINFLKEQHIKCCGGGEGISIAVFCMPLCEKKKMHSSPTEYRQPCRLILVHAMRLMHSLICTDMKIPSA